VAIVASAAIISLVAILIWLVLAGSAIAPLETTRPDELRPE
jgi:hypothetical protein